MLLGNLVQPNTLMNPTTMDTGNRLLDTAKVDDKNPETFCMFKCCSILIRLGTINAMNVNHFGNFSAHLSPQFYSLLTWDLSVGSVVQIGYYCKWHSKTNGVHYQMSPTNHMAVTHDTSQLDSSLYPLICFSFICFNKNWKRVSLT